MNQHGQGAGPVIEMQPCLRLHTEDGVLPVPPRWPTSRAAALAASMPEMCPANFNAACERGKYPVSPEATTQEIAARWPRVSTESIWSRSLSPAHSSWAVDEQHGVPFGLDEPQRRGEPAGGDSACGTGGLREAIEKAGTGR